MLSACLLRLHFQMLFFWVKRNSKEKGPVKPTIGFGHGEDPIGQSQGVVASAQLQLFWRCYASYARIYALENRSLTMSRWLESRQGLKNPPADSLGASRCMNTQMAANMGLCSWPPCRSSQFLPEVWSGSPGRALCTFPPQRSRSGPLCGGSAASGSFPGEGTSQL